GWRPRREGADLRITDPKALDVPREAAVLLSDLRERVGQPILLDWNLAKQLKEFCDGLNTQLARGGDKGAQPSHQHGSIASLWRRSETPPGYHLLPRHTPNHRDGGGANIPPPRPPPSRGLDTP